MSKRLLTELHTYYMFSLQPIEPGDFDDKFHTVICLRYIISYEETFPQDFLKHLLQKISVLCMHNDMFSIFKYSTRL